MVNLKQYMQKFAKKPCVEALIGIPENTRIEDAIAEAVVQYATGDEINWLADVYGSTTADDYINTALNFYGSVSNANDYFIILDMAYQEYVRAEVLDEERIYMQYAADYLLNHLGAKSISDEMFNYLRYLFSTENFDVISDIDAAVDSAVKQYR
jgi:hypothetical protein